MTVPFNRVTKAGKEAQYMGEVLGSRNWAGGGSFTQSCEAWLQSHTGSPKVMLTSSCTSALEIAAMLIGTQPGDEIIMPSYTFVSTANAFVLRGGIPVFVDICSDTLNIDSSLIEAAITPKTKAIVVVHYAGVGCDMDAIMAIAKKHHLRVIEDNAHGIFASYKGKPLGSFGDVATLSFHETKNISCGQGGALIINDTTLTEQAHIYRDKGTNRHAFEKGDTAFYTWVGPGSNYTLSEMQAAILWAQLEQAESITASRLEAWQHYYDGFSALKNPVLTLPVVPEHCQHNGHIFALRLPDKSQRDALIAYLAERHIGAVFHYIPLHSSPAYKTMGHTIPNLPVTDAVQSTLVRMPLWAQIEQWQERILDAVADWLV